VGHTGKKGAFDTIGRFGLFFAMDKIGGALRYKILKMFPVLL